MINVLVIAERGGSGFFSPCGYLRLFLPLTKSGVERELNVRFVSVDGIDDYPADIVVTHRVALISLDDVEKVQRYCRRTKAQWIFDLDDDLLALNDDHPESNHYHALKPIILSSAANADQMWASTSTLADTYRSITADVAVVPNTLDQRVWRPDAFRVYRHLDPQTGFRRAYRPRIRDAGPGIRRPCSFGNDRRARPD